MALLLLVWELRSGGGIDPRRVARRGGLIAVAALIALSYGNPEGWVAARNLTRYAESKQIDFDYLLTLSPNAMPAIVRQTVVLTPFCRTLLIGNMRNRLEPDGARWFEWNFRRIEGRRAVMAARIAPWATTGAALPSPVTCWN
jgi:hypothetical protein